MKQLRIRPPKAIVDPDTQLPEIEKAKVEITDPETGQTVDLVDEIVGLELQLSAEGCYVTVDLGPFEPDIEFDAVIARADKGPTVADWLDRISEDELDRVLANGGVRDSFSGLILEHLRNKARPAAE